MSRPEASPPAGALVVLGAALALGLGLAPSRATAIPVFAHRYGFSCEQCHSTVPHLNDFGERFRAAGFRIPGAPEHGTLPVAIKVNLAYSSEPDPNGLPKALVDEVELLSGGSHGKLSYFVESYVVDGGRHGNLRDAWICYTPSGDAAPNALRPSLRAGQFTLDLPADPESFRLTENHYAVFDQTVGANPFKLFEPRLGVGLALDARGGAGLQLLALKGHDPQSGLPSRGLDTMIAASAPVGPIELSAYRYAGSRLLPAGIDSFWRLGYAASVEFGKLELVALSQAGNDTHAIGAVAPGTPTAATGGFLEGRWIFSPALTAVARYDGTNDPSGLHRSTTISLVRRLRRNSKITLEDVFSPAKQTFNAALLFAY